MIWVVRRASAPEQRTGRPSVTARTKSVTSGRWVAWERGAVSIVSVFAVLVLLGIVRSFSGPVSRAMLPHLERNLVRDCINAARNCGNV